MRRRGPMKRHGDDGSTLIVAISVMMILSTLTLAILARTLSTMGFVRHGQDYDAALAAADAGLAQAVYRIEQGARVDWRGTGTSGKGTYDYFADFISATEFTVASKGTVGKASHGIRAKVTRSALFPYALFGYDSLAVEGSTSSGGSMQFDVVGMPGATVNVGTNGYLSCNGSQASNIKFRSANGYSGCPPSQWEKLDPKNPRLTIEPPPQPNQPCPLGGVFTGTVDGGAGLPYVCRQNVTFSGTISVTNGPVIVYVLRPLKLDGTVDMDRCSSVDMTTAVINQGGAARNFQLYKDGSCPLTLSNGNTASTPTMTGILYAPQTVLEVNGGKSFIGSVMVASVKANGAPNLKFSWDANLATYYGPKWKVSRYAEVPSPAVYLPQPTTTTTTSTTTTTTIAP